MRQEERAAYDGALHRARVAAYDPGEFVGQESFMTAGEILALAARAGIGPGARVLDLCCGVAGPGRWVTRQLGCSYTGVDTDAEAIALARERAADLSCRFEVAQVPPVPPGPFDVVVLLETMLAFEDKEPLLREVASALVDGGRFVFTLEEGAPLTVEERRSMPDADTVWLEPLDDVVAALGRSGLRVRWTDEHSRAHLKVVDALIAAFEADAAQIAAGVGPRALEELLAAHRLWSRWLGSGRVRKLAVIAEKAAPRSWVSPPYGAAWPARPVGAPAMTDSSS